MTCCLNFKLMKGSTDSFELGHFWFFMNRVSVQSLPDTKGMEFPHQEGTCRTLQLKSKSPNSTGPRNLTGASSGILLVSAEVVKSIYVGL